MINKKMTVENEIKRQYNFSVKQDGRADGGYYATLCKFKNEDNGTYEQFLKKYPLYSWYGKREFYDKD